MKLWALFPESLIHIPYVLQLLPVMALLLYLYLLYAAFRRVKDRPYLIFFLSQMLITTLAMVISARPSSTDVLLPGALLLVMLVPLLVLMGVIYRKSHDRIALWCVATLAGWSYSLGWWVWILAMARS